MGEVEYLTRVAFVVQECEHGDGGMRNEGSPVIGIECACFPAGRDELQASSYLLAL